MVQQKTKQHAMPVVLQNLPPAETLNQVVDNLNYLALVMDEAFTTIESQINDERKKIDSISQRVSKASTKTDLIAKYPNKATTVFSSSVFPTPLSSSNNNNTATNNNNNNSIDEPLVEMTDSTESISRPKYKLSLDQRIERPPVTDTLQLYHRLTERIKYQNNDKILGLGKLPSWLTSVSDCLLFNRDENPYVKYESLDNLEGKLINSNINNIDEQFQLTAAPKTIVDKVRIMDTDTYDIAYRPELGDVPVFNVTTTLAGLGNLALDIGWQGTKLSNQKIAPSGVAFGDLHSTSVLPDNLPGFDELDGVNDINTLAGFGDGDDNDIVPPPPEIAAPPPQDNSIQPPQIHVQPNDVGARYRNPNQAPMASIGQKAPSPEPSDDGGGARGGLLAAIRAGKKLQNSKKARKSSKKAPIKKAPLTLMDHLKMKLQARNAVMRGKSVPSGGGPAEDNDAAGLDLSDDEKEDKTGLGLSNVPQSMRHAMMIPEDNDVQTDESWEDE